MDDIRIAWLGGEHPFRLPLGRLRALQDNCNAGPEEIFKRIRDGSWRVDDLAETLRQGLMGAGMADKDAGPLVIGLMEKHPIADFKMTAYRVLHHALLGPEGDQVGKPGGVDPEAEGPGGSRASTEAEPS
ncbi:MAG: gene transfer agent family protein [Rhodobacteraceae bacterium]|nr:gene transfer agent family protein [Paracoccaceae bacterium]MBR9823738.1 gene transfer agent family protein [Paracoccaceae bacterium]